MKERSLKVGDRVTILNLPDDQKGVIVGEVMTVTGKRAIGSKASSSNDAVVQWQVKLRGSARIVDVPSDQLTLIA